jgi:hypothetical protein
VLARVGRESLAVIPARALGGFRRAGAGYREMRALWERRRADDGGGTLAPAFFLATHETLEAGRNCLGLTGRMRPWAAYTALGLVLATVWAAAWAITSGDPIAAPVTFLLAGAAGSFAMRQEPSQQFARRMCEGQGDFTPMAVRVGEDALVETTALGERRYRWDQVREIMEGKFVIVFRTGDAEAVVVPRRAFRSTRDADLFHRTAETYRFAALGEAAVWPPLPRSAAAAPAPGGE